MMNKKGMSFMNLFLAGIIGTFILTAGGIVLLSYMGMYGLNTNDSIYRDFNQNANLISDINTHMGSITAEINSTAPQAGFITLGYILMNGIGIVKDMLALGIQILRMPVTLLTYSLYGLSMGLGFTLAPTTVTLTKMVIGAIMIVMLICYVVYVILGRGGSGGQNAV